KTASIHRREAMGAHQSKGGAPYPQPSFFKICSDEQRSGTPPSSTPLKTDMCAKSPDKPASACFIIFFLHNKIIRFTTQEVLPWNEVVLKNG
ncbi:MAG: hypothetical protein RRX88_07195, partial [Raoultibacter sp.]